MTDVRQLCEELAELVKRPGEWSLVHKLITELSTHGSMDIRELWRRIGYSAPPAKKPARKPFDRTAAVKSLGDTFYSDDRFRAELGRLSADRSASKADLIDIYKVMYGRAKKFAAKATRDKILQEIADERNMLVRSKKTAAFLSGS